MNLIQAVSGSTHLSQLTLDNYKNMEYLFSGVQAMNVGEAYEFIRDILAVA